MVDHLLLCAPVIPWHTRVFILTSFFNGVLNLFLSPKRMDGERGNSENVSALSAGAYTTI
jgi:hypothetical protein